MMSTDPEQIMLEMSRFSPSRPRDALDEVVFFDETSRYKPRTGLAPTPSFSQVTIQRASPSHGAGQTVSLPPPAVEFLSAPPLASLPTPMAVRQSGRMASLTSGMPCRRSPIAPPNPRSATFAESGRMFYEHPFVQRQHVESKHVRTEHPSRMYQEQSSVFPHTSSPLAQALPPRNPTPQLSTHMTATQISTSSMIPQSFPPQMYAPQQTYTAPSSQATYSGAPSTYAGPIYAATQPTYTQQATYSSQMGAGTQHAYSAAQAYSGSQPQFSATYVPPSAAPPTAVRQRSLMRQAEGPENRASPMIVRPSRDIPPARPPSVVRATSASRPSEGTWKREKLSTYECVSLPENSGLMRPNGTPDHLRSLWLLSQKDIQLVGVHHKCIFSPFKTIQFRIDSAASLDAVPRDFMCHLLHGQHSTTINLSTDPAQISPIGLVVFALDCSSILKLKILDLDENVIGGTAIDVPRMLADSVCVATGAINTTLCEGSLILKCSLQLNFLDPPVHGVEVVKSSVPARRDDATLVEIYGISLDDVPDTEPVKVLLRIDDKQIVEFDVPSQMVHPPRPLGVQIPSVEGASSLFFEISDSAGKRLGVASFENPAQALVRSSLPILMEARQICGQLDCRVDVAARGVTPVVPVVTPVVPVVVPQVVAPFVGGLLRTPSGTEIAIVNPEALLAAETEKRTSDRKSRQGETQNLVEPGPQDAATSSNQQTSAAKQTAVRAEAAEQRAQAQVTKQSSDSSAGLRTSGVLIAGAAPLTTVLGVEIVVTDRNELLKMSEGDEDSKDTHAIPSQPNDSPASSRTVQATKEQECTDTEDAAGEDTVSPLASEASPAATQMQSVLMDVVRAPYRKAMSSVLDEVIKVAHKSEPPKDEAAKPSVTQSHDFADKRQVMEPLLDEIKKVPVRRAMTAVVEDVKRQPYRKAFGKVMVELGDAGKSPEVSTLFKGSTTLQSDAMTSGLESGTTSVTMGATSELGPLPETSASAQVAEGFQSLSDSGAAREADGSLNRSSLTGSFCDEDVLDPHLDQSDSAQRSRHTSTSSRGVRKQGGESTPISSPKQRFLTKSSGTGGSPAINKHQRNESSKGSSTGESPEAKTRSK